MSEEVVDSNPYSRLMALQRMGIVTNYERIRQFSVVIVGLGGVGSVAAEMLTRCGIGKLIMFDYDTVELANMNRLFFRPDQAGKTKTQAAYETLNEINPDVIYEPHTCDITKTEHYSTFLNRLRYGGKDNESPVDLVLGCVDNFTARITINRGCLEVSLPWMESGVSENAMSGHIQFIKPGETACFDCAPPLIVAEQEDERKLKREGVCAASLPTTMSITAALLIQNVLKYLLEFGEVSDYLGYNALRNYFPSYTMKPNVDCSNKFCCMAQEVYQRSEKSKPKPPPTEAEAPVVHSENPYGITLEDEDAVVSHQESEINLPQGLHFSYSAPTKMEKEEHKGSAFVETGGLDIEALRSKLSQLSNKK
uniref:Ubiquitin-like modifier-activating enzyme 5 n=1 Tax=Arcella intermedia TaxID=1963864 RepID=A0A6B2L6P5_9EUKA